MTDTQIWISVGATGLSAIISLVALVLSVLAKIGSKKAKGDSLQAQKQAAAALAEIAEVQTKYLQNSGQQDKIAKIHIETECRGNSVTWTGPNGGPVISPVFYVDIINDGPCDARKVSVLLDGKKNHLSLHKGLTLDSLSAKAKDRIVLRGLPQTPPLPALIKIEWEDDSDEPRSFVSPLNF